MLKVALVIACGVLLLLAGFAFANRWFFSYLVDGGLHTVTYQVTGDAETARVTYLTPDGSTSTDVTLPWEISLTVPDGMPLELRSSSVTAGSITCRIKWEGHTLRFDTAYSSQAPACASASTA